MVLRLPFLDRSEFENVGFWAEGKTGVPGKKTSWGKGENQQQTQPTYGASTGICTWATLVGGERSHYCAIGATLALPRSICTVRESPGDLAVISIQSRFLRSQLDTKRSWFDLLRRGCCVVLYKGFFSYWRRVINPKRLCFLKNIWHFDISLPNITLIRRFFRYKQARRWSCNYFWDNISLIRPPRFFWLTLTTWEKRTSFFGMTYHVLSCKTIYKWIQQKELRITVGH